MAGKTLWQRWTERPPKPVEEQYYNPLEVRVGGSVSLDVLDWRDLNFVVRELREYDRPDLGAAGKFTDYVLLARPINGADVWARLRCFKKSHCDKGELPFQPVLLTLDDEFAYNEDFIKHCSAPSGLFEVFQDGVLQATYKRCSGLRQPCDANVSVVQDMDGNGKVEAHEVTKQTVQYWDYSRTAKDEAQQDFEEYVFAELDKGNGWTQIWKGQEIDPERVVLM